MFKVALQRSSGIYVSREILRRRITCIAVKEQTFTRQKISPIFTLHRSFCEKVQDDKKNTQANANEESQQSDQTNSTAENTTQTEGSTETEEKQNDFTRDPEYLEKVHPYSLENRELVYTGPVSFGVRMLKRVSFSGLVLWFAIGTPLLVFNDPSVPFSFTAFTVISLGTFSALSTAILHYFAKSYVIDMSVIRPENAKTVADIPVTAVNESDPAEAIEEEKVSHQENQATEGESEATEGDETIEEEPEEKKELYDLEGWKVEITVPTFTGGKTKFTTDINEIYTVKAINGNFMTKEGQTLYFYKSRFEEDFHGTGQYHEWFLDHVEENKRSKEKRKQEALLESISKANEKEEDSII